MKYTIISADSTRALIEEVTNHIAEGWQPLGGVAASDAVQSTTDRDGLSSVESKPWFVQAMIKTGE